MATSLESYFYLSSSNHANNESGPIVLPRETEVAEKQDKSLLRVASALAFICVRDQKEVYAVAIRFSGQSSVIFLAENYGVPRETEIFLETVVSELGQLARSQPSREEPPNLRDTVQASDETPIGTLILKHTFPKFFSSLTKRDSTWDARVASIRVYLAERSRDLKLFQIILQQIGVIYRSASLLQSRSNDALQMNRRLTALYGDLSTLETFIRRSNERDELARLLAEIDRTSRGLPAEPDSIIEDDLDLDLTENNTLKDGFSMTRFIFRIIAVNIHIRRLLRLAVSPTYKSFFDNYPIIKYCPPVERSAVVDPSSLLKTMNAHEGVVTKYELPETITGPLHAELSIFSTLLQESFSGESPYPAIGVSKLSCVGCYAIIAKAFPQVIKEHEGQMGSMNPFIIQGTHGKMYWPWVAPDLSFATHFLPFDLDLSMRIAADQYLREALAQYIDSRCLSDSSIGSGTSDRLEGVGDFAETAMQLAEIRDREISEELAQLDGMI
ncbi:hypothetical protein GGX14DRAFT_584059 [Mycena pura]|uniref:Uncharacterized protein n=1 Tax=Mycena pura TaxID=153505 RepID=A0AAD6YVW4_9AGAR|nr:hypothetical protein GGX14DRAFT_584059 [Mycena pura]